MSVVEKVDSELDAEATKNYQKLLDMSFLDWKMWLAEYMGFLEEQAAVLGLQYNTFALLPTKPIVIISWPGTEPCYPAILLYSGVDANGIQYLEVVKRLKHENVTLKRTLYLCFVLEEDIDEIFIMEEFVRTAYFRRMSIGFSLGPGAPSRGPEFLVFNGHRCIWKFHVYCIGNAGPTCQAVPNTAVEKLSYLLRKLTEFTAQEEKRHKNTPCVTPGDMITVNVTQINSGVDSNFVPPKISIAVTCYVPVDKSVNQEFEATLSQWCTEAGRGVWIEYEIKDFPVVTNLDNRNPYWAAFRKATDELNLSLNTQTLGCRTGNYFLRCKGIPALDFTPVNNSPQLLRDSSYGYNYGVEKFLQGIEIYKRILTSITEI